jgi:hypothetical protein
LYLTEKFCVYYKERAANGFSENISLFPDSSMKPIKTECKRTAKFLNANVFESANTVDVTVIIQFLTIQHTNEAVSCIQSALSALNCHYCGIQALFSVLVASVWLSEGTIGEMQMNFLQGRSEECAQSVHTVQCHLKYCLSTSDRCESNFAIIEFRLITDLKRRRESTIKHHKTP